MNSDLTASSADFSQKSLWRRLNDFLFGYDYFISYAWADGRQYAVKLAEQLESRRLECFLDSDDYAKGDDWKLSGQRALRKTTRLVLIGSPRALESKPVLREVRIFTSDKRHLIPISFAGSLDPQRSDSPLLEFIRPEVLRIEESPDRLSVGPSPEVVDDLTKSFKLLTQEQKRTRFFASAAGVFAVVALVAIAAGVMANYQWRRAEENLRQVEETLAASILTPITPGDELSAPTIESFWTLATLPPSRQRVRALFFEEAFHDMGAASRLRSHGDMATTAGVGLNLDLRNAVVSTIMQRLRDLRDRREREALEIRIACVAVGNKLEAFDTPIGDVYALLACEALADAVPPLVDGPLSESVLRMIDEVGPRLQSTEAPSIAYRIMDRSEERQRTATGGLQPHAVQAFTRMLVHVRTLLAAPQQIELLHRLRNTVENGSAKESYPSYYLSLAADLIRDLATDNQLLEAKRLTEELLLAAPMKQEALLLDLELGKILGNDDPVVIGLRQQRMEFLVSESIRRGDFNIDDYHLPSLCSAIARMPEPLPKVSPSQLAHVAKIFVRMSTRSSQPTIDDAYVVATQFLEDLRQEQIADVSQVIADQMVERRQAHLAQLFETYLTRLPDDEANKLASETAQRLVEAVRAAPDVDAAASAVALFHLPWRHRLEMGGIPNLEACVASLGQRITEQPRDDAPAKALRSINGIFAIVTPIAESKADGIVRLAVSRLKSVNLANWSIDLIDEIDQMLAWCHIETRREVAADILHHCLGGGVHLNSGEDIDALTTQLDELATAIPDVQLDQQRDRALETAVTTDSAFAFALAANFALGERYVTAPSLAQDKAAALQTNWARLLADQSDAVAASVLFDYVPMMRLSVGLPAEWEKRVADCVKRFADSGNDFQMTNLATSFSQVARFMTADRKFAVDAFEAFLTKKLFEKRPDNIAMSINTRSLADVFEELAGYMVDADRVGDELTRRIEQDAIREGSFQAYEETMELYLRLIRRSSDEEVVRRMKELLCVQGATLAAWENRPGLVDRRTIARITDLVGRVLADEEIAVSSLDVSEMLKYPVVDIQESIPSNSSASDGLSLRLLLVRRLAEQQELTQEFPKLWDVIAAIQQDAPTLYAKAITPPQRVKPTSISPKSDSS